jgi:hypothetical protein
VYIALNDRETVNDKLEIDEPRICSLFFKLLSQHLPARKFINMSEDSQL